MNAALKKYLDSPAHKRLMTEQKHTPSCPRGSGRRTKYRNLVLDGKDFQYCVGEHYVDVRNGQHAVVVRPAIWEILGCTYDAFEKARRKGSSRTSDFCSITPGRLSAWLKEHSYV
jgi:hypothetical protein